MKPNSALLVIRSTSLKIDSKIDYQLYEKKWQIHITIVKLQEWKQI